MGRALAGILLLLVLPLPIAEAGATERYLVSFHGEPPALGVVGGARVLERFPFAGLALVDGPRAAVERLPGAASVHREEPVQLAMERERGIVGADAPSGAAWPSGSGVTVALVDSGIDAAHPAFDGRVLASVRISKGGVVSGEAGDSDGHGTHVAGIVGGDGSGSVDARHRGIAPEAGLVGIDISDSFTTTNAVRAFAWIDENAARYNIRVVSNSWGREKEGGFYDADDPVTRASDALVANGIVVVFSAGNRGRDGEATLTPEAMNPNVITVGAASGQGRVEGYSSRGPAVDADGRRLSWAKPDLMAPGTAVVSTRASALADATARTDEERYYTVMNGTSMAAPQVAAAAALLLSQQPGLSPADVGSILRRTAGDLAGAGVDDATGYGMLDVTAALLEAQAAAGGERRIVVEQRVPVHHAGTAAAALGQVVLANNAPRLPPTSAIVLPLALPPGSAALDLWFNWSGEGSFSVRLVGPEGATDFERLGGQALRLTASVAPGSYRVEATPTGTAAHADYELGGAIVVREERLFEVAMEQTGRPARSNGVYAPVPPSETVVAWETVLRAPLLAIAAIAICAVGFGVTRAKRSR